MDSFIEIIRRNVKSEIESEFEKCVEIAIEEFKKRLRSAKNKCVAEMLDQIEFVMSQHMHGQEIVIRVVQQKATEEVKP